MKQIFIFVISVLAITLLSCGTGSEVVGRNATIEGRAVDRNGLPVAAATVRIRPNGFCALYNKFSAFDTITDADGFFYFDTLPVDSYTIEINSHGKIGTLQNLTIRQYDTFPMLLPQATLTSTGTIFGRINLPISDDTTRPWVALYNVDYIEKVPFTQDFRFEGVPEGTYVLRIVSSRQSKFVLELYDIKVIGDSTHDVGTLTLFAIDFFKGCASRECDSIAIQSILDANGLSSTRLSSVTEIDSATGRVVALNLSSRGLTRIPKDIGSLSQLLYLDLRNNHISVVPDHIGYLRNLQILHLDSNSIVELPMNLYYLNNLQILSASNNHIMSINQELMGLNLDTFDLRNNLIEYFPSASTQLPPARCLLLDNNKLSDFPFEIGSFKKMDMLTVKNNRLCMLSSSTVKWLDGFDSTWRSSQRCDSGK
jgi:hypothetical protein